MAVRKMRNGPAKKAQDAAIRQYSYHEYICGNPNAHVYEEAFLAGYRAAQRDFKKKRA